MEIATRGWDAKVEKVKADESAKKALAKEYQKLFESQVDLGGESGAAKHRGGLDRAGPDQEGLLQVQVEGGHQGSACGAASLVTTVAIMASSGATFGASAIPGILGVMRTSAQLAQQCKALYDELETTVKQLNKNLAKVSATYKDASKAKLAAAEMSAMLIQKVLVVRDAEHQALPGPAGPSAAASATAWW